MVQTGTKLYTPSMSKVQLMTSLKERVVEGVRVTYLGGGGFAIPLALHMTIFKKKTVWIFLVKIVKLSNIVTEIS